MILSALLLKVELYSSKMAFENVAGERLECKSKPRKVQHKKIKPHIPIALLVDIKLYIAAAKTSVQAAPANPLMPTQEIKTAALIRYLDTLPTLPTSPNWKIEAKTDQNKMNMTIP